MIIMDSVDILYQVSFQLKNIFKFEWASVPSRDARPCVSNGRASLSMRLCDFAPLRENESDNHPTYIIQWFMIKCRATILMETLAHNPPNITAYI